MAPIGESSVLHAILDRAEAQDMKEYRKQEREEERKLMIEEGVDVDDAEQVKEWRSENREED